MAALYRNVHRSSVPAGHLRERNYVEDKPNRFDFGELAQSRTLPGSTFVSLGSYRRVRIADCVGQRTLGSARCECVQPTFLHRYKKRIMYGFKDPSGEYYGGQGLPLGATRAARLRTIVLYRTGSLT